MLIIGAERQPSNVLVALPLDWPINCLLIAGFKTQPINSLAVLKLRIGSFQNSPINAQP